jgi:hypothetical protein
MPPRPGKSSSADKPTPLAGSKGQVTSSADIATQASQVITKKREKTKPNKVRVIALQDGYDGLTVIHKDKRLPWSLADGEKLPSWLMLEAEYDRIHTADDDNDGED